jgi:hypothetical protein
MPGKMLTLMKSRGKCSNEPKGKACDIFSFLFFQCLSNQLLQLAKSLVCFADSSPEIFVFALKFAKFFGQLFVFIKLPHFCNIQNRGLFPQSFQAPSLSAHL